MRGTRREAAILRHAVETGYRFESTEQHASGKAIGLAADVHAVVHAVDGVDIGMAGGTEEDLVPRRGSAMRVGGGIGRVVVRAEIGLDLDDASGDQAMFGLVDEELAEEFGSDELGAAFEEAAGEQATGGRPTLPDP